MPEPNIATRWRERTIGLKTCDSFERVYNANDIYGVKSTTEVIPPSVKTMEFSGSQVTGSEGHPFRNRPKGIANVGGPFDSQKTYIDCDITPSAMSYSYWIVQQGPGGVNVQQNRSYSGPLLAIGPSSGSAMPYPPSNRSSDAELNALGATAIARCKPDNSIASTGTALGEILHGGLHHHEGSASWKDKTSAAQKAGSEYLAAQFGWLPLVNDIREFASAVRRFNAVLKQYERDAGRLVRRRYEFPSITSKSETVVPGAPPWFLGSAGNCISTYGTRTLSRTITKRRWFSGAFTYHLPTGYDSRSKVDRYSLFADRIGLKLSPQLLWELAPWSWAVDWFSNAGDVISNVDSFTIDGNVLAYGYIMEHTIVRDVYTYQGGTQSNGSSLPVRPVTLVTETKVRRGANPYGFGVTWDGLSPFQISILTALGLQKSR